MSRTRVATVASCLLPLLTLSYAAAEQPSPSHYEVLSVPRDVAADALRAAYKREAKAWHPDKHPAGPKRESAKDKFVAANEAFATLSDPEKRAEYDMRLADVAQGRMPGASAYGGYGQAPPRRAQVQTIEVVVRCSLEQLGGWRPVHVHNALRHAYPELALTLVIMYGPLKTYLPPGSRVGDRLRLPLGRGIEIEMLISGRPHRTFRRRDDALTTLLYVPRWHNWRKPAVHTRAVCGTRVCVRARGEAVPRGGVSCTVAGYGMPTRRPGVPPSMTARGDLLVTLRLRSLRAELGRLATRIGPAAAVVLALLQLGSGSGGRAGAGRAGKWTLRVPRFGLGGGKGRRRARNNKPRSWSYSGAY